MSQYTPYIMILCAAIAVIVVLLIVCVVLLARSGESVKGGGNSPKLKARPRKVRFTHKNDVREFDKTEPAIAVSSKHAVGA